MKGEIEQCECFLLIIAGTYGTLNQTGVDGNKYGGLRNTEMEYRYIDIGIRVLCISRRLLASAETLADATRCQEIAQMGC